MEMIFLFFDATMDLSLAMAPYILFGLLFAGLLHELVPQALITRHLGSDSLGSVVKATFFGIPLPVCSCGVVPLAASIKKSGASNGAVLSFLISTPITGVDSILATFGMFGWVFTLYRVVTSMIIALVAGVFSNLFASTPMQTTQEKPATSCCSSSSSCTSTKPASFSLKSALTYGFITLFKDIYKPLFLGLLIGALITVSLPTNFHELFSNHMWLSYLISLLIAVPMYVCATASLPIAAGLILAGVSPGAAFVFLTAGPATNTVTIGVVKKMLGSRVLVIYLGSIILGSIFFGLGLDWLFSAYEIVPSQIVHTHEQSTLLDVMSAFAMWLGMGYFYVQGRLSKKKPTCCSNS